MVQSASEMGYLGIVLTEQDFVDRELNFRIGAAREDFSGAWGPLGRYCFTTVIQIGGLLLEDCVTTTAEWFSRKLLEMYSRCCASVRIAR